MPDLLAGRGSHVVKDPTPRGLLALEPCPMSPAEVRDLLVRTRSSSTRAYERAGLAGKRAAAPVVTERWERFRAEKQAAARLDPAEVAVFQREAAVEATRAAEAMIAKLGPRRRARKNGGRSG